MHSALIGILFCLLFLQTSSILNGNSAAWPKHAYLVKVFARAHSSDRVSEMKSCTGSLITNSLVLTASSCVINEMKNSRDPLDEFAVILSIRGTGHREKASLLKTVGDWAILEIRDINVTKICPQDPGPKSVLELAVHGTLPAHPNTNKQEGNTFVEDKFQRLNLKPTLKASSVIPISSDEIVASRCFVIGFNTTEQASKFLSVTKTLRLDVNVEKPREHEVYFRSKVSNNFTTCFDDVGAPLICETVAHGPMVVGMFQKLGIPIDNRVDPQIRMQQREHCLLSREMYFNILTEDSSLIDFLDEFQIPSIATTYQACKFPSHPY